MPSKEVRAGRRAADERRAFRERLRMEAAGCFQQVDENAAIADDLRVSVRSRVLERELARGPAAHGWPDQMWTLSRIKTLIERKFHKSYTVQSVAERFRRHAGAARARPAGGSRDEAAVAAWAKENWP